MTREEMRERLEKAIRKLIKPQHPQQVANIADAAIAIIRGETLEEAAKEMDAWGDIYGDNAARAIRALGAASAAVKEGK